MGLEDEGRLRRLPTSTGKGNGRSLAGQRGCLQASRWTLKASWSLRTMRSFLYFSKRAWAGFAKKGGVPKSRLPVDTARVTAASTRAPCPSGVGCLPDEAPAGDDLGVAVVDGLALQAQRVPLHTAVPWEGTESVRSVEGSAVQRAEAHAASILSPRLPTLLPTK